MSDNKKYVSEFLMWVKSLKCWLKLNFSFLQVQDMLSHCQGEETHEHFYYQYPFRKEFSSENKLKLS